MKYAETIVDLVGDTPLVKLHRVTEGVTDATVLVKLEYFNPGGSSKDRIAGAHHRRRRARGQAEAGRHDRGADLGQHRRGPRAHRAAARLQVHLRVPRQGRRGQAQRAHRLRRRGRRDAHRRRARQPRVVLRRLRPARTRDPRRVQARPVLEPQRAALALRDHRPRDLARHRRQGHALRRRRRHGRHDHGHRAVPARGVGRHRAHHRRRPRGLGLLGRHRPPVPRRGRRRGLLAGGLRPRRAARDHRRRPTPSRSR